VTGLEQVSAQADIEVVFNGALAAARDVMIVLDAESWLSSPDWIKGLSDERQHPLGIALVAGRKRVPSPAAGKTAFANFSCHSCSHLIGRERAFD